MQVESEMRALPQGQSVAKGQRTGSDSKAKIRDMPKGRLIAAKGWGGPKQWVAVKTGALPRAQIAAKRSKSQHNDCDVKPSKRKEEAVTRRVSRNHVKEHGHLGYRNPTPKGLDMSGDGIMAVGQRNDWCHSYARHSRSDRFMNCLRKCLKRYIREVHFMLRF
ncbi:hypothetical protein WDU94_003261 [Cyamophila willieti]